MTGTATTKRTPAKRAARNAPAAKKTSAKRTATKVTKKATVKKKVNAARPSELPVMTAHFPLNTGDGTEVPDLMGGATGELMNVDASAGWVSRR